MSVVLGSMIGASLAGVGVAHFWPFVLKRLAIPQLRAFCTTQRLLCLTYDDGPGQRLTPQVVNLLAHFDAKATFFLVGRQVLSGRDRVDQLRDAGHELGCHTQQHFNAWKVAPWTAIQDIRVGYQTLAPWLRPDALFRPPHGKPVLATWCELRRRQAPVAWWTHDSGDTYPELPELDSVVSAVQASRGGVVLMHDKDREDAGRERYVMDLTERLLRRAATEGMAVVTMGEVLKRMRGAA